MHIEMELGRTLNLDQFVQTHPDFFPFFENMIKVTNVVFGREYQPNNRLEIVGFDLGQTCRDDYMDIVFLSMHGHQSAVIKLLRGLYERALAVDYMMITEPPKEGEISKAERFFRYAAIQEHRSLQAALDIVSEEAFDTAMAPKTSAAQIRENYQTYKADFEEPVCKKCRAPIRVKHSWDVDVPSMARKVGEPYKTLFLLAYTIPTSKIHATLASTFNGHGRLEDSKDDDIFLIVATEIFLQVLRSQNQLFSLGVDAELEECGKKFRQVWPQLGYEESVGSAAESDSSGANRIASAVDPTAQSLATSGDGH